MPETVDQEIRTLQSIFWSERDPDGLAFAPLADAFRRSGRVREALDLLTDGMSRHPGYATGHVVAARLYVDQGMHSEAELAARRVLELDPENLVALSTLVSVLSERGEVGEAARHKTALFTVDPDSKEARAVADLELDAGGEGEGGEGEGMGPGELSDDWNVDPADAATPLEVVSDEAGDEPPVITELVPETMYHEGDDALLDIDDPAIDSEGGSDADAEQEEGFDEDMAGELAADPLGLTNLSFGYDDESAAADDESASVDDEPVDLASLAPDEPVDLASLAPDEPVDLASLAPDEEPAEVADIAGLAPDEEADEVVDLAALAPDEEDTLDVADIGALAHDEEPDHVADTAALAPDEESAEVADIAGLAPDEEADEPVDLASLAPDEPVDLASLAPDEEPAEVADIAGLAPEEGAEEVADIAGLAPDDEDVVDLAALAPETSVEELAEEMELAAAEEHDDDDDSTEPIYTRTLADLYIRQGFHDKALEVLKHIQEREPDATDLAERIAALETGDVPASGFGSKGGAGGAVTDDGAAEEAEPGAASAPPPPTTASIPEDPAGQAEDDLERRARELAEPDDEHAMDTPFAWGDDEPTHADDEDDGIGTYLEGLLEWETRSGS